MQEGCVFGGNRAYEGCVGSSVDDEDADVETVDVEVVGGGSVEDRFLVSKFANLRSKKGNSDQIDYDSSQTESPPLHLPKTKGIKIKTLDKQGTKDEFELSAESFTQDLKKSQSHSPSLTSSQNNEGVKLEVPESCMNTMIELSNEKGGTMKKTIVKWKRKDGNRNEASTSGYGHTTVSVDLQDGESCSDDLVEIFNSVTENQYALVFRRRLDSQKIARYRKTIRQHMDLDTIRSKIANCGIKSTRELFRDLLVLANNALVFYSKRTREYKSAMLICGNVSERYKQLCSNSSSISNRPLSSCFSPMASPPVRPKSIRPRGPCKQQKLVVKFPSSRGPQGYLKINSNSNSGTEIEGSKSHVDFLGNPKTVKRVLGRPRSKQPPPTPRNRKKAYQN